MHVLYDFGFSGNGWKVRRTLRLLGIPHRWVAVDILAGETRTPGFLARNPVGEVPVLELPDGTCLAESHAILQYLAEGTRFLPSPLRAKAEVVRWLCFEQTHIDGVISRARFRRCFPDAIPTTEADFARWHRQGTRALRILDAHLAAREWLACGSPTIADIAVAAYVQVAGEGGFSLEPFEAVRAWLDRVAALPGHIDIADAPPAVWDPGVAAPLRAARCHYVLAVPDLERTVDWFVRTLGCTRSDVDPGNWVFVDLAGARFMLGRCPDALDIAELGDHGYFAYLVVDDVDAFHARAVAAGADVLKPPRDEPWGMREVALRTVDGHRMMLGQVTPSDRVRVSGPS